jgi:zinc transport system ATP-binding protein
MHFHGRAEDFERMGPEILLRSYGHDVHLLHHDH